MFYFLFINSCNQQLQNEQKDEASIVQPIRLELNLSGNSRSSRFLGTYDEIDRLTLDLNRVYGNRKVVTGMELNKDNQTSKWIGSIDKLIVGFDYTITGHAYKTYDNGTSVEIFRGETLHTVDEIRFLMSMMKEQLSRVTVSLMGFATMTVIMG